jgi:hypothetical protein
VTGDLDGDVTDFGVYCCDRLGGSGQTAFVKLLGLDTEQQALAKSGVGNSANYTDVTTSRAIGTVYENTSNADLQILVILEGNDSSNNTPWYLEVSDDGSTGWETRGAGHTSNYLNNVAIFGVVESGKHYRVRKDQTFNDAEVYTRWLELEVGGSGSGSDSGIIFDNETATAYDLTEDDLGGNVYKDMNNSSDITVTVPSGLTGTEPVTFEQTGAGVVIFSAGGGVTINAFNNHDRTAGQYATVTLIPKGSDVYVLSGNTAAL